MLLHTGQVNHTVDVASNMDINLEVTSSVTTCIQSNTTLNNYYFV